MIAPPGSARWLLLHELRLFRYNAGRGASRSGGAQRGINKTGLALGLGMSALLHVAAYTVLSSQQGDPAAVSQQVIMLVTGMLAAVVSMMMSTGLKSSVEALFERGDLDLLLSSPLSSRSIFTVRLAANTVGIAGIYLFFLAPVANAGLALGQFRWLGIYPSVIGLAVISAAASMLFTLGLVRVMGIRRTRVVAQVLGAVAGALFFLLSQLFSTAFRQLKQPIVAWFEPMTAPGAPLGPDSAVWLPGHAVLGAPLPLLALSLLALAIFLLTVRYTHRFFVSGVQQAVSSARVARKPAAAVKYVFGRSLMWTVMVKEWRLIVRDPQLISQVLLQLLYLLPLCAILLLRPGASWAPLGSGLVFIAGSLAAALAWIIIAAEDAPDLLRAAPCNQATIRQAKLAAAIAPPLMLVALPLLWTLWRDPLAALLMYAMVTAAATASALIAMWQGRPSRRGDFTHRAKGNFQSSMFELLSGAGWAGLTYLLLAATGDAGAPDAMVLAAPLVLAASLAVLALAWALRRRQD